MKQKLTLSAIAGIALMMGACSSDEPVGGNSNVAQRGEDTYTAFSISMNSSASRIANDDNADAVEQTIPAIQIYIFSGGVLEVASTPAINDYVTIPVKVTTGEKIIYAVAAEGTPFAVTVDETLLSEFENKLFASLSSDIAVSGKFHMIGRANATIVMRTEQEAQDNPIGIKMDRSAAKVQVKFNNPTVRQTLAAQFNDAYFGLAQQARRMYVELDQNFTQLGAVTNGTYAELVPVGTTDTALGLIEAASTNYDVAYAKNLYTAECVAENPTTGNVTFAIVRVKCTPDALYGGETLASNGTFWAVARNEASTATWVYASDEDYNIVYFDSENHANAFIADKKLDASKYKAVEFANGYVYYRVNIMTNPDSEDLSEKYRVVRNYCYHINVTDIKALGAPTAPGVVPENPDTPLEQDSWMVAEIDVNPWNEVERDVVLQ